MLSSLIVLTYFFPLSDAFSSFCLSAFLSLLKVTTRRSGPILLAVFAFSTFVAQCLGYLSEQCYTFLQHGISDLFSNYNFENIHVFQVIGFLPFCGFRGNLPHVNAPYTGDTSALFSHFVSNTKKSFIYRPKWHLRMVQKLSIPILSF